MRRSLIIWILAGICAAGHLHAGEPFNAGRHLRLIFLQLRGIDRAELHIAVRPDAAAAVAQELTRRGADIRFRAEAIGYFRAWFPFRTVGEVDDLLTIPGVEAVEATWTGMDFSWPSAMRARRPTGTATANGGEPALPLLRPHSSLDDMAGAELRQSHPTFDGRGVLIGQVEAGWPDLLHPKLQHALTLDGQPARKFRNMQVFEDTRAGETTSAWIAMRDAVRAERGVFTAAGREYTAPHDGTFRIGFVPRAALADALPTRTAEPASDPIPVLWEPAGGTVWVDTNVDRSFADERALQPLAVRGDIGHFGGANPVTPDAEPVGFVIEIDAAQERVRLNFGCNKPGGSDHATWTAGHAAAAGIAEGRLTAVAGNAQLALFGGPPGMIDPYTQIAGLQSAMEDRAVDVIFDEPPGHVSDYYDVLDGRLPTSLALDRLAANSGKPVFVTAGNTWGLVQVVDTSVGGHVISVGTCDSAETLRTNFAADTPYADNLSAVGSFGPAGNGRLKPDLVAPAGNLTTTLHRSDAPNQRIAGVYSLPREYRVSGGTSCATPTAASAAAMLISAAKQSGVRWENDRIRFALFSTARPLGGIPSYQQGRGVIQIGPAWDALCALDKLPSWSAPDIDVDAPVKTAVSRFLSQPDRGEGIFEREGWGPNQKGRRVIRFTRRNGPASPVTYELRWLGDTAYFTSAATLTLPLNQTIELPVDIATREARVYSAILRLWERGLPVESLSLATTIVAAEPLGEAPQRELHRDLSIRRPGVESLFVQIPPGATALELTFDKSAPETITFTPLDPTGRLRTNAEFRDAHSRVVVDDLTPGVWEFAFDNRKLVRDVMFSSDGGSEPRSHPLTPTAASVRLRLLRVSVDNRNGNATAAGSAAFAFHNTGASILDGIVSGSIGHEHTEQHRLLPGQPQVFDVTIPAGAKLLRAELRTSSEAEVRLLFFQDFQDKAYSRGRADGSSGVAVRAFENPAAARWHIVVDPLRVPSGGTDFTFRTVIAHESFGTFEPESPAFSAAPGETTVLRARVKAAAQPTGPDRTVVVWAIGAAATESTAGDRSAPSVLARFVTPRP